MNEVKMTIVGVPNVTIIVPVTDEDRKGTVGDKSVKRTTFDKARVRYAQQGATEVRYGWVN